MEPNDHRTGARGLVLGLVLTVCPVVVGQDQGDAWAQPRQAALAEDILSGDAGRSGRAVVVAEALGPSRMAEEVRVALIALLEHLNSELDAASAEGLVLNDVVNGEFFLAVGRVVATLNDVRAIPGLVRFGNHGYSRHVARGLASLGEEALPATLEFIDSLGVTDSAMHTHLLALTMMVEGGDATVLSEPARAGVVRVAREGLRSDNPIAVRRGIEIAGALKEPGLIESVVAISEDPGMVAKRGVGQWWAQRLQEHAVEALTADKTEAR